VISQLEADPPSERRGQLATQLAAIREAATTRREKLARKLAAAESFIGQLDRYATDRSRA
ncbi:hypothetical protein G6X46_07610, partial [Staphylococcus aureus]|nr:hypothetical protein [Staphylococcus aureus]